MTEAKSKVAESLDDYRGCYQYNLIDEHMRRFNAEVSQIVMWDDHEVRDNWYWERRNDSDARYTEKSVAVLAARGAAGVPRVQPAAGRRRRSRADLPGDPDGPAGRVFALDMRSYKGANSDNRQPAMDGVVRGVRARRSCSG